MSKNDRFLHEEELEQVRGGQKHITHKEFAAFIDSLFSKRQKGRKHYIACENPKHKQKQG